MYRKPIKIERFHLVLVIGSVGSECFGDVEGNKHAILEIGWNLLNRGCLINADIAKTRPDSYDSNTEVQVQDENSDGNISEEESNNHCCNGNQCDMQTSLGPRDTD